MIAAWVGLLSAVYAAELPQDRRSPDLGGVRFESNVRRSTQRYPGAFDRAPAFQWRTELPGDPLNASTHAEYSRPVIIGPDLLIGSAKGSGLYRLSRSDGTVIAVYPASASVQAEALVVDDRVYFSDTDGVTWAYSLAGDLLWSFASAAPILVRPTLHQGSIFVTNVDDLALALDAETGALRWRYQARLDPTRVAELRLYAAPPAIPLDDLVVLGFSDGTLVGVEADSGDERWYKRIGEGRYPDIVAAPVPFGEDLYASAYFEPFVAVDQETRTVRWRVDVGSAFGVTVDDARDPTVLYHPGTDGKLRAYSALTGAERWVWDSGTSAALTAPVLTEAGLLIGSSERGLYLVDAETGRELWSFHEPFQLVGMSASPVVDGRQVLFSTNAGELYAMVVPRDRKRAFTLWEGRDRVSGGR